MRGGLGRRVLAPQAHSPSRDSVRNPKGVADWPTARKRPAPARSMPYSSLMYRARLGLCTIDQACPDHRSMSVRSSVPVSQDPTAKARPRPRTSSRVKASPSGVAKLPIGGGGVITAALFVDYDMLKEDFEGAKADITRTTIGTSVGVSVWF